MTDHIIKRTQYLKNDQTDDMRRNDKDQNKTNTILNERFYGMKRERCEGSRVDRFMVYFMHIFEYTFVMHDFMCPIKICIMNEKHEKY